MGNQNLAAGQLDCEITTIVFIIVLNILMTMTKKLHQKEHASIDHKIADHSHLIRVADDLLNDSKFTCKSQCVSLSNMFFRSFRHEKSQERLLQRQILIVNKSTFLTKFCKRLNVVVTTEGTLLCNVKVTCSKTTISIR